MTRETIVTLAVIACIFGGAAWSDTGFDTPVISYPCGMTEDDMDRGIWGLMQPPGQQYATAWPAPRFDLIAYSVSTAPNATPVVTHPETSPVPLPAAIWGLLAAVGVMVAGAWASKRGRA